MFWATWGHKVPHVPASVHTSEAHVATLMKWVTKARGADPHPADAQRFCLAIGIILRDLTLLSEVTATSTGTNDMPEYLATSKLDPGRRSEILDACSTAFVVVDTDIAAPPEKNSEGKGEGEHEGRRRFEADSSCWNAGLRSCGGIGGDTARTTDPRREADD